MVVHGQMTPISIDLAFSLHGEPMRLRISALLLLSVFVIPVLGCSSETPATPTQEKTSTVVPGPVAKQPGGKAPRKPKDLSKLKGPVELTE